MRTCFVGRRVICVVADKIARADEQVEKVELALAPVKHLVVADVRLELVVRARGQMCICRLEKRLELCFRGVPLLEDIVARQALAK